MEGFKGRFVKGPEPESVYWKRRAIVAGAVSALVLMVVLGLNALGGSEERAGVEADAARQEWRPPASSSGEPSSSPEPSPSPSAAPSSSAPPAAACPAEQLTLQVVAAFGEVRSGAEVPVSVLVASAAAAPCTVDLGSVAVELAAGPDVVSSTAHCLAPQGEVVELSGGAGRSVELTVDGLASDEGCLGSRRELPAGDYELRARLGAAVSSPTALRLT